MYIFIRDLAFKPQTCTHSYVPDISSWVSNRSFQIQYVQTRAFDLQPLKTCSIHSLHHLGWWQFKNSSKVKNLRILINSVYLLTFNQTGDPILRKYSESNLFPSTSFTLIWTILISHLGYSNSLLTGLSESTPALPVYCILYTAAVFQRRLQRTPLLKAQRYLSLSE